MVASRKRRFGVENLEQCAMLAGDVTVRVSGGELHIKGDNLDNVISIAVGPLPRSYVITGTGTAVNGQAAFTALEVNDDFDIKLRGGNDSVTLGALTVPGELDISMDAGDDTVTLNADTIVRRGVEISTSSGFDTVTIAGASITGVLKIKTNGGEDVVSIATTTITKETTIETGDGDDQVTLSEVTLIQGSSSRQSVEAGILDIETGDGLDAITLTDVAIRRLKINSGADDDTVALNNVFSNVEFGIIPPVYGKLEIDIRTGDGDDTVTVAATFADVLTARLGNGDDAITLEADAIVDTRVTLFGGKGVDTLTNNAILDPPLFLEVKEFEIFLP